jgi:hypothetical protein
MTAGQLLHTSLVIKGEVSKSKNGDFIEKSRHFGLVQYNGENQQCKWKTWR